MLNIISVAIIVISTISRWHSKRNDLLLTCLPEFKFAAFQHVENLGFAFNGQRSRNTFTKNQSFLPTNINYEKNQTHTIKKLKLYFGDDIRLRCHIFASSSKRSQKHSLKHRDYLYQHIYDLLKKITLIQKLENFDKYTFFLIL